jgi:hypothetical protein
MVAISVHFMSDFRAPARSPDHIPDVAECFLGWQIQLGLIPPMPESWLPQWASYHDTYRFLLAADSSTDANTLRAIHIDVVRLSRYSGVFGNDNQEHFERIERILRLFGKFNSPDGYRQAHHELLFPLYYVAVTGRVAFDLDLEVAEAIAFFMFHALVSGTIVGDFFLVHESAVVNISERALNILKICDSKLYRDIQRANVTPVVFAFSWITVLFVQIYSLAPLLRLWDFLFDDIGKMALKLSILIAAHLVIERKRLAGKAFVQMMAELTKFGMESEAEVVAWAKNIQKNPRIVNL